MEKAKCKERLKLLSWNVFGLGEKLKDRDFVNTIIDYDMVCLTETWLSAQSDVNLKGFRCIKRPRNKRRKKGRRSGGIILYFKKWLSNGIKEISKSHEDLLWVKLDRYFFGFDKDVYICIAYIKPNSCNIPNSAFLQLEKDISRFDKYGHVVLVGDFNARTGELNDFVMNDTEDKYFDNSSDYSIDSSSMMYNRKRMNKDKKINNQGRELINLCQGTGLRIANGRTVGDLFGEFTFYKHNGKSAVDYIISSKHFLHNIQYVCIGELSDLSDHCPVETVLECNITEFTQSGLKSNLRKMYDRFIWKTESSEVFLNAMKENDCQLMLQQFMMTDFDKDSTNVAVQDFTSVLALAGNKSLKCKKHKCTTNEIKKRPWFDEECYMLRKSVRKCGRHVKKNANYNNLHKFRQDCKHLKSLLKQKKLDYKHKLIKEMELFDKNNPKAYWNNLAKLRAIDSDSKIDDSGITSEEWVTHFKLLASENRKEDGLLLDKLTSLERKRYTDEKTMLDYAFTMKEVKSVIRQSGNGKSPSDDLILYEMFKSCINLISPALTKLFNIVLDNEIFPAIWNVAYQVPVFKGGDMFDTNNFRGISITSCLGKLFNKAMNNRLQQKVEGDLGLKDTQAAYRPDYSTTDQIFILNSLINKYVKFGKKKLYVCFVDFKKAFDNIWHTGLLFKLLKQFKIGGKFYGIIKSMYRNAKTCVKLKNGITEVFDLKKGIKQGDTLSPYLFNMYLNDINGIFAHSKSMPPSIAGYIVGCLLYADDLMIISESKSGLQHSLDNLNGYCDKWKLQLNVKKTKVMIFTCGRNEIKEDFKFGNDVLCQARTYSYLGVTFNRKGSYIDAINILKEKGNKAMYLLKGSLYTGVTFQPELPLKIFDSTIRPILAYASEVWCVDYLKLLLKPNLIDKSPFELINNRFCKGIMGLPRQASNFGVKAELGRNPIFAFICSQVIRYWARIINMDSNRLLKFAYLSELTIHREGGTSWATFIMKLLDIAKENKLWVNQGSLKIDKDKLFHLKKAITTSISESYFKKQFDMINISSKLRTFAKFKKDHKTEKYINISDIPLSWRKLFCAFRISCHNLEIERGRYSRPKKPPEDRICKLCHSEAETEIHFISKCIYYKDLRKKLYSDVMYVDNNFNSIDDNEKFEYLMTNDNTQIIKFVMQYIYLALKQRKQFLCKV